jgi:hypothetical protein
MAIVLSEFVPPAIGPDIHVGNLAEPLGERL